MIITRVELSLREPTCVVEVPEGAAFFRAGMLIEVVEQVVVGPDKQSMQNVRRPVERPVAWAHCDPMRPVERRTLAFVRDGEEPVGEYVGTFVAGGSVPIHVHVLPREVLQ